MLYELLIMATAVDFGEIEHLSDFVRANQGNQTWGSGLSWNVVLTVLGARLFSL